MNEKITKIAREDEGIFYNELGQGFIETHDCVSGLTFPFYAIISTREGKRGYDEDALYPIIASTFQTSKQAIDAFVEEKWLQQEVLNVATNVLNLNKTEFELLS